MTILHGPFDSFDPHPPYWLQPDPKDTDKSRVATDRDKITEQDKREEVESQQPDEPADDEVDEAAIESFPASDPPSFTKSHA